MITDLRVRKNSFMPRYWIVFIAIVLIAGCISGIIITVSDEYIHDRRLVRDDWDRGVYMDRAAFVEIPGARPYTEVFSEYPQLATYFFTIPYIFKLFMNLDKKLYMDIFTFMMAFSLGILAFVWLSVSQQTGADRHLVLCLLLPGTLYFTLNRYDIIPSLLVLCALALLFGQRPLIAFTVLSIAFLTKAYPVILLPLFFIETLRQADLRKAIIGCAIFFGIIAGFSIQLGLWSGWDAIVKPYSFQLGRELNDESLYALITQHLDWAGPVLKPLFLILQGIAGIAVIWFKPRTPRGILRWVTVMVTAFVLFNRFQSPQWVVWITPVALLAAVTPVEIILIIFQDIITYIYFPLIFDQQKEPWMLPAVLWTLTILRLALIIMMLIPQKEQRTITQRPGFRKRRIWRKYRGLRLMHRNLWKYMFRRIRMMRILQK